MTSDNPVISASNGPGQPAAVSKRRGVSEMGASAFIAVLFVVYLLSSGPVSAYYVYMLKASASVSTTWHYQVLQGVYAPVLFVAELRPESHDLFRRYVLYCYRSMYGYHRLSAAAAIPSLSSPPAAPGSSGGGTSVIP